jgi:hypothetical protein
MSTKIHKDCFAYSVGRCRILTSMDCERCKFYKTNKQYAKDIDDAKKVLDAHLGFPASKLYYEELLEYLEKKGGK